MSLYIRAQVSQETKQIPARVENYILGGSTTSDYDDLSHRPVDNLTGSYTSPINIASLGNGSYKITGYFLLPGESTAKYTNIGLFVQAYDATTVKYFKIVSFNYIYDYLIQENEITKHQYLTEDYLSEHEYTTSEDVSKQVAAMKLVSKEELPDLVNDLIDAKVIHATEADIEALFEE